MLAGARMTMHTVILLLSPLEHLVGQGAATYVPREDEMNTERDLKNVLTLSREVRIRMHDSRVIYASVVAVPPAEETFLVRPWGVSSTIALRFADVSSARPVSRMGWQQQRTISAAQAVDTCWA